MTTGTGRHGRPAWFCLLLFLFANIAARLILLAGYRS